MSAREQAISAYQLAKAAAEAEEQRREEERRQERLQKERVASETYEAALPILNSWFPGVDWTYDIEGDWGHDVIITDAGEEYPTSFKLLAKRIHNPQDSADKWHIELEVGKYRQDSSMPGYSYFSGTKVKSAADIGRYLEMRNK